MSEKNIDNTHASRVLPNPHIEMVDAAINVPEDVKAAEIQLLNAEQKAINNGMDQRILPMGSLAIKTAETARAATTDNLTGLLNREGLELWYERYAPENAGIIVADARGFKKINDEYGEDFGDRVITFLGNKFESKLRTKQVEVDKNKRDSTNEKDVVAVSRWGGDEITAVVNLDEVNEEEREMVMNNIKQRLEKFGTYNDDETGVSGIELEVRSVFAIVNKNDGKKLKDHIAELNHGIVEAKKIEK
jgi:diguanylate cyclase (GGDEF)-like protein